MRLLLDTHTFLWWAGNDPKLSPRARDVITRADNTALFSSINAWELAIKKALGRLTVIPNLNEFVSSQIRVNRLEVLSFSLEHALRVDQLPDYHKDPFDRALIAQAMVEGIPIATADRAIARYPIDVIW